MRQGHEVTLVPIYTPTRTDEPNVSERRVLYGGVNVYLQQVMPFFRRTPRFIDRLFDSRPVMKLLSRLSVSTDPERLADLTVSTLKGEDGFQRKEVEKLVEGVLLLPRPDVVLLPNSLMIALARPLRAALGLPDRGHPSGGGPVPRRNACRPAEGSDPAHPGGSAVRRRVSRGERVLRVVYG